MCGMSSEALEPGAAAGGADELPPPQLATAVAERSSSIDPERVVGLMIAGE